MKYCLCKSLQAIKKKIKIQHEFIKIKLLTATLTSFYKTVLDLTDRIVDVMCLHSGKAYNVLISNKRKML